MRYRLWFTTLAATSAGRGPEKKQGRLAPLSMRAGRGYAE